MAPFSCAALALEAERTLVAGLQLEPVQLDPALARAEGVWKGAAVTIETRAWRGGPVHWARVATVSGAGLEIGNVLALPSPDLPLPILGADLVSLGARGAGVMIAADLSPVLPPGTERDRQLAPFAAAMSGYRELTQGGELPAWCARWFSPHALYVRPTPDELPRAAEAFRATVRSFVTLAAATDPDPSRSAQVAVAHRGYAAAHREDDKGLGLLGRMFGERWADRYLREVLFPES